MGKITVTAWRVYYDMKRRCTNPKASNYKRYGGRGIKICNEWMDSFDNFLKDMGEPPNSLTLDRINNNGNYEPSNCRWATWSQQARNTSITKLTILEVYAIKIMHRKFNYDAESLSKIFCVGKGTINKYLPNKKTGNGVSLKLTKELAELINEEKEYTGMSKRAIALIAIGEYLKKKEKERLK